MIFPICRAVALIAILVLAGCRRDDAGSTSSTKHSSSIVRSAGSSADEAHAETRCLSGRILDDAGNAAAGGAGCPDLGDVRLVPARRRSAALCTVRGTVKHSDGTPAFAAIVEMSDSQVSAETRNAICQTAGDSSCKPGQMTEEDGKFSVTAAVMEDFYLGAMGLRDVAPEKRELEYAGRIFGACPRSPVVLTLDPTYTAVVFLVDVAGNAISWVPEQHGITRINVISRGGVKWEIQSAAGKVMRSPLLYGVVPPGATQTYPVHGTAAPLASGDTVAVWADGSSIEGEPHTGSGDFQIPERAPTAGEAEQANRFRNWFGQIFTQIANLYVHLGAR